ncbi:MAG: hypothetical protein ACYC91_15450 [Solirubrobacteraceae bacterium]
MPTPKQILEDALNDLADRLSFQQDTSPESHTLVIASGLDDPEVPKTLAHYAVGALAGWVQHDATIAERYAVRGIEHKAEIQALVAGIIQPSEDFTDEQLEQWRQTSRDPWIAEVLIHALLVITRTHTTGIVSGPVHALMPPHPVPKRQGLDAVAIYEETTAVVAIGETKASEGGGSAQLTVACDAFDHVEKGLSGPDLRDALKFLAPLIPPHLAAVMPEELWRDHRCYLPAIVHQTAFDGTSHRPRLHRLTPALERKRLLLLRTTAFRQFFDEVAAFMPNAIDELVV